MPMAKRRGQGVDRSASGEDPLPWEQSALRLPTVQWWRAKPAERASAVTGTAATLMGMERWRMDRYERYFRLYGGTRIVGIRPWEDPGILASGTIPSRAITDALRLNVCKAAVDTITSKVGKLRPRPTFVTDHGKWDLQLRAKQLQQFMDGAYHESDAHELGPDVFRDAMVFGTGVLHPYHANGKLRTERVPPWELFVDPADALYGKPRVIWRIKWVSRDTAGVFWPKVKDFGSTGADAADASEAYRAGYVRVIEGWCRAIPGREQGAHILVVGGEVVDFGAWAHEEFPFVFIHWSKPIQGFWGDSAIQEVVGLQVEINKLIQLVQKSMQLVGQPWVFRKEGAILRPDATTNTPGTTYIVEGTGSIEESLTVQTFQPVHPQVVAHIWSLYAKAFEILGSNQLAASATAPAGLESGRALEALSEEHSERFMTVSRHFEHCMGELLARQFIRLAKELDEEVAGGYVLRAPGKSKQSLKIAWKDVAIDEDGFLIQVWPESVLPATPAARINHVAQLQEMGTITPDQGRRIMRFPDLEAEDDYATADADNLRWQLAQMLEHGEPVTPEPYQNLSEAVKLAQQAVLRSQADGAPSENVDLVREFISSCEALLQRAASAQPPPPAPPAAPQGAPGIPTMTPPGQAVG
jgi:hypothetical protein